MIDLFTNGAPHQTVGMRHLQKGILEASGEQTRIRAIKPDQFGCARACVLWGTRYLAMARNYGRVYVLEAGYFNTGKDRLGYYSLGIDGLNGRARFNNANSPSGRWIKHGVSRQPWRHRGDYILIMGQVPGDMATHDVDLNDWYSQIAKQIRQYSQRPLFFRPHPMAVSQKVPADISVLPARSLDDALKDAAAVVTFNSNSGIDAALAGVPVYAHDIGSMAWPIAAHSIKRLFNFGYPDRCQWSYNLAYTQWTAEELQSGEAWEHICQYKRASETETKQAAQQLNR